MDSDGMDLRLVDLCRTDVPVRKKKMRLMVDIMATAPYVDKTIADDDDDYSSLSCEECGLGDKPGELLICDKCDLGHHMSCLRPIVVRVPIRSWICPNCTVQRKPINFTQKKIMDFFRIHKKRRTKKKEWRSTEDTRRRRKRSRSLVLQKKKRRLLPYVPSEDPDQRIKQMGTLAIALSSLRVKYSDELNYVPGKAPKSANQAEFQIGGMQILPKEDVKTLELCRAMSRRGECPPLVVVYDTRQGYTIEADGPIKDLTLLAEYAGDVDYLEKWKHDDCDSLMTLITASNPSESLVICPDKRGNIVRFISGINNHTLEGRKKKNCKCIRYNVDGECRVLLIANRDIAKGERLYYDYNSYENEYPTEHFI